MGQDGAYEMVTFDDARRTCRPVIDKVWALAADRGAPPTSTWLDNREYMVAFTAVYNISTQANERHSAAQMYAWFCELSDAWVDEHVAPALRAARDVSALIDEVRNQYERHRGFARWLVSIFMYLERYHTRLVAADSLRCVTARSLQRAVLRAALRRAEGEPLAAAFLAWLRVQWGHSCTPNRVPPTWLLDEPLTVLADQAGPRWARAATPRSALRGLFASLAALVRGAAARENPYEGWAAQLLCADVLGGLADPFLCDVVRWPDGAEGPRLDAWRDALLRPAPGEAEPRIAPEDRGSLRAVLRSGSDLVAQQGWHGLPAPHAERWLLDAHRALLARHLAIVGAAHPAVRMADVARGATGDAEARRRACAAAAHRPFQLLLLAVIVYRARDCAVSKPLVGAHVALSCDLAEMVRRALRAAPPGRLPPRVEFAWHAAARVE